MSTPFISEARSLVTQCSFCRMTQLYEVQYSDEEWWCKIEGRFFLAILDNMELQAVFFIIKLDSVNEGSTPSPRV